MLRVTDISKSFGNFKVLHGVSFNIKRGERVGIIGPNGAGKTTLFNIISGFLKPDSGRVEFNGRNIVGKKPSKIARMGVVRTFQIVKLFENMTVKQNIEIVGDEKILRDFNLWDKRDELAKNLSYGEMKRLSIAMALCLNPKVLLLDEPFSGLDARDSSCLADIIREMNGITTVVVEHRLGDLFDVVERVIVLNSGKVIFDGDPDGVLESEDVRRAYLGSRYATIGR
ncbi:MAG: ABC transporter ATP-binding protein [Archaeoglobales archaeon]|nr:MAG: ABC transporter ATP-binding protein [Archaeoglobales archaeon]